MMMTFYKQVQFIQRKYHLLQVKEILFEHIRMYFNIHIKQDSLRHQLQRSTHTLNIYLFFTAYHGLDIQKYQLIIRISR